MKNKYLTIKEFAEAAHITPQSLYKRLAAEQDELKRFFKEIDGKKYLSETALKALYNIDIEQEEAAEAEEETAAARENKFIEILKEQLEAQRKDIEEKNKLIDRLAAQLEKEQQLLHQEQQLNLLNHQKILELEAAKNAAEEAPKEEETPVKSGFFSRLFKFKK